MHFFGREKEIDLLLKQFDKKKAVVLYTGARQVGKTWLMQEFGRRYYKNTVYFNFDEEEELKSIFEANKNPLRIIELLSMLSGEKIEPGNTLILFDEIQECPDALNSLKYFCEKAREYHVIVAGSLLGMLLSESKSYPVGKVNLIEIAPLSFGEFLQAVDEHLYQYYVSLQKEQLIEEVFHNRLLELYHYYLIIGGMPECVNSWVNHKDPKKVLQIQKELIAIYENDFAKHNKKVNAGRILQVFRSIVTQLAKGALTENFVLQQMKLQFDTDLRYYSNRYGEIDFLVQNKTEIIPVEVKGGTEKSAPTFKKFIATYNPKTAIRFSENGYVKNGSITNIPLYLTSKTNELL